MRQVLSGGHLSLFFEERLRGPGWRRNGALCNPSTPFRILLWLHTKGAGKPGFQAVVVLLVVHCMLIVGVDFNLDGQLGA